MLLDLGLVNQNSFDLVSSFKKKFPELKMIVTDLLPVQSDIVQFIEKGVTGFNSYCDDGKSVTKSTSFIKYTENTYRQRI